MRCLHCESLRTGVHPNGWRVGPSYVRPTTRERVHDFTINGRVGQTICSDRPASIPPGRPVGFGIEGMRAEAARIMKVAKMGSLGSISERIRQKGEQHAARVADMERRLDAMDAKETGLFSKADAMLTQQEHGIFSLETDLDAMDKALGNGGPTSPSPKSDGGSGEGEQVPTI